MTDLPPRPPSPSEPPAGSDAPGPAVMGGRSKPRENATAWMVTFTDLVALLLTFFVMIFAMSTVKVADWQSLTDSLRRHLNSVVGETTATPALRLDMPSPDRPAGTDLDYLAELLRSQLRGSDALADARLRLADERLYLSLPADLLFATGSYQLTDAAADAVFRIGGVLRNLRNGIEVVGHADPRKPQSRYPSNWELSLLRARSVAAALADAGVAGGIRTRGHGDSLYAQLPDGLAPEARRRMARRVDIVIQAAARETDD